MTPDRHPLEQLAIDRAACPRCGAAAGAPCVAQPGWHEPSVAAGKRVHRQRKIAAGLPHGTHHNRDDRDARAIAQRACPECGAPAGQPCRTPSGRVHNLRR